LGITEEISKYHHDKGNILENRVCAYCGKEFSEREGWPHVEGDFNRGVLKIEHFCSEKHKYNFLNSKL
jgi:ribosomal protein L24E